ncbi:MAG TPA: SURF1 family protein [Caulobacteraceae bacterium]
MRGRFPLGLTVAAVVTLVVLVGLGAWQVQRLAWKTDLLARIERLKHAPPRPLADVLAQHGIDLSFTRVETPCAPTPGPAPSIYRYALRQGQVGWRLMGACRLTGGTTIALDRGLVNRFAGGMAPAAAAFPPAVSVVGVLRKPGSSGFLTPAPARSADGSVTLLAIDPAALKLIAGPSAAPYYLAVENETPPPPGISPAALPEDIPNNHFVYALTWFGLAGVLVWMWAAFVVRRMRGR